MPISISQSVAAIKFGGLSTSLMAVGGVSPYTWTVIQGGAGGTIDSNGIYTSPANGTGTDIIQVTDSTSPARLMADTTIMVGNELELFCDIIQNQMNLTQGQVYLWNQKINIPTDSRLYVAVRVLSCRPFGNSNILNSNGDALQSVNMGATLSVDILSRGTDARDRKEEVILALLSDYSQSQQELNSFYIARLSTAFIDLSEIDGAAIPYRFNISVGIQYFVVKTLAVPYFDTFQTVEVDTND